MGVPPEPQVVSVIRANPGKPLVFTVQREVSPWCWLPCVVWAWLKVLLTGSLAGAEARLFCAQGAPSPLALEAAPEPARDGLGRIGVRLSPNSYINHVKATDVGGAFSIATGEFLRCASQALAKRVQARPARNLIIPTGKPPHHDLLCTGYLAQC